MNTLLSQGVELMLIGMGVVFVFLMMLVALVSLMSALVGRFVDISVPEAAASPSPAAPVSLPDAAVIQAIEQAVHAHRQSRR